MDCKEIKQSILKEINPEYHWKDWCWSSDTLATWWEQPTHWKRPWCWERLRAGGEGDDRGWDSWIASPTQWTWIWANSRRWWRTEEPGVLQFMRWQRVRQDLAAEQQQADCTKGWWLLWCILGTSSKFNLQIPAPPQGSYLRSPRRQGISIPLLVHVVKLEDLRWGDSVTNNSEDRAPGLLASLLPGPQLEPPLSETGRDETTYTWGYSSHRAMFSAWGICWATASFLGTVWICLLFWWSCP